MIKKITDIISSNKITSTNKINIHICSYSDDITTTLQKFTLKEKQDVIKKLNITKYIKIMQQESYFRDLLKLETNSSVTYYKKKSEGIIIDDKICCLVEKIILKSIDSACFPILSKYHYVYVKNIELYELDNLNILFISQKENEFNICLQIKNNNISELTKDITNILKLFDDFSKKHE